MRPRPGMFFGPCRSEEESSMSRSARALPAVAAGLLVAACAPPETPPAGEDLVAATSAEPLAATVRMEAIAGVPLSGEVQLVEVGEWVRIEARIEGLPEGLYGFHIHEGRDCEDRGGHYDPHGRPHGSPDEPEALRHAGDLGNLVSRDGVANFRRYDPVVRLDGDDGVVGRVMVIHAERDQFLPQPTGDAGAQIGCGRIEASDSRR